MNKIILVVLALIPVALACKDAICGHVAGEGEIDERGWPPPPSTVGHAAWTYLHAIGAYLPRQKLSPEDKAALSDLVTAFTFFYPSEKGRDLWKEVVHNGQVVAEFNAIQERDDVRLWIWKVHNCITANSDESKPMFPESDSSLTRNDFLLVQTGGTNFRLADMTPDAKERVLAALHERWMLEGGLDQVKQTKNVHIFDHGLPPDRAALGRSAWTLLHTMSVYMPTAMNPFEINAFRNLIRSIRDIYPCELCRHHFQEVYPDPILQQELGAVIGQQGAILFLWKMHNIVTTNQHPKRGLFPHIDKEINEGMFTVPTESANQIRLGDLFGKYNLTFGEVMWKYNERWKIIGGIDTPLDDFPSEPSCAASNSLYSIRMDVFLMAMCPWCAKAMRTMHEKKMVGCSLTCVTDEGTEVVGAVHWNVHYVGMANNTGYLEALHGPHEKLGDKLELCARDMYSQDYKFMDFIACMDRNITLMPTLAESCATKHGMNYDALKQCADLYGEEKLAKTFAYSSSRRVDATPTIMINDDYKMLGLKKNLTAIMCQHMLAPKTTQTSLQHIAPMFPTTKEHAAARIQQKQHLQSKLYEGPAMFAAGGFVLFIFFIIAWHFHSSRENNSELKSLLEK